MLVCFEGTDGSGKATQSKFLVDWISEKLGEESVSHISFPRYGQTFFAREVAAFLNGEFGSLDHVHPRLAAQLFAGDRYESRSIIDEALANRKIVVCDRYVASNAAHQGARLPKLERPAFLRWVEVLEYSVFHLPVPNLTIFLDVSPEVAWRMIEQKSLRSYTERKRDIQEAKLDYLCEVYSVYKQLASDQGWLVVDCCSGGRYQSQELIAVQVRQLIGPYLEKLVQNYVD